jgi:hypothetical protein
VHEGLLLERQSRCWIVLPPSDTHTINLRIKTGKH